MKQSQLKQAHADELLRRYVEIGVEQDDAMLEDDNRRYNRLFKEKIAIDAELRSREGDQRRLLMRFYDHPNWQVRLNAAYATLAVAPIEARRQFEQIAASNHYPQAADARSCLGSLDDGTFKPK
jgi:hypothetical protein